MIDLEPIIELAKCRVGRVRGLQRDWITGRGRGREGERERESQRDRQPQTARQTRERAHRKVREDIQRERWTDYKMDRQRIIDMDT